MRRFITAALAVTLIIALSYGRADADSITFTPIGPLNVCKNATATFFVTHTGGGQTQFAEAASSNGPAVATVAPSSLTTSGNPKVTSNYTVTGVAPGSTTIKITDSSNASGATLAVNVTSLASPSPTTLNFNGTTAGQTFSIQDNGPSGAIVTATSNNTNVATVNGPLTTSQANGIVTFTVTPKNGSVGGVTPATATISISDNSGCTTGTVTATVTPGSLSLSTNSLTFTGVGAAQTFTASETDYTGPFSVATPTPNPSVATIAGSGNGPGPVTFTVTPVGFGSTTASINDDHNGKQSVTILVSGGSLAISGSSTVSFTANDNTNAHLPGSAVRVTGALQTTSSGNAQIYVASPADITGTHGGTLRIARLTYNCTGNGAGNNQGATFATGFLQLIATTAGPNCMTFPASQFSNLDFNLNLFLDDRSMPADTYTSTNGFQVVLSAT